jgi:hypothetical protein
VTILQYCWQWNTGFDCKICCNIFMSPIRIQWEPKAKYEVCCFYCNATYDI